MQHQIKQQQLLLTISNGLGAFRIQQLASDYYWHTLLPALEEVFNSLSSDDEIIQMDKLEIDLGSITGNDFEQNQLPPLLGLKIREICKEKIFAHSSSEEIIRKSKPQHASAQWLFYMQHGYMPWDTIAVNEQWYGQVLESLAADFGSVTALRDMLALNPGITSRIVYQHPENFLVHLVEILTAKNQKDLPSVIHDLYLFFDFTGKRQILIRPTGKKEFEQGMWKEILNLVTGSGNNFSAAALSEKIILQHIERTHLLLPVGQKLLRRLKFISPVLSAIREKIVEEEKNAGGAAELYRNKKTKGQPGKKTGKEEMIGDETGLPPEKKEKRPSPLPGHITDDEKLNRDNIKKAHDDISHNQGRELDDKKENDASSKAGDQKDRLSEFDFSSIDRDGVFVQHAGVVLIHPFLSALFNRLRFIEANKFADGHSRQRAIHLIHFLATGKTTADEFELAVPKFLCGYPLDEPIQREIDLTKNEQSEAEDMLQAVIMQWDKIKNTSVAAFRESFLQRKGKLYTKDNAPYLQVEAHAIDLLLDYLPWTLSLVRLPWMKEMLHVEWR